MISKFKLSFNLFCKKDGRGGRDFVWKEEWGPMEYFIVFNETGAG